ncbi:MAG: MBL fold metallo-hydrolase [Actinomycetota bacterium]|nr:MBL fold metallo-hydrolase [Actinomycetota bacterium]
MEALLLGSGGWMPTDSRETACTLLREGDRALAIDAGTAFRHFVTDPELLAGVERLDVVLTHFHLDHTIGLSYLPGLDVPVEIWAAGRAVAGTPTVDLLHRLLDPPFLLRSRDEVEEMVASVHELEPPGARIGPFDVRLRVQPKHPSRTVALRANDVLVHCTDTAYDEENVEFARGARVLVHEAFHAGETTDDAGHTAAGEAARLAAAAGVERLVLIHPGPVSGGDDERLASARPHFAATEVGRDGMRIELGDAGAPAAAEVDV